MKKELDEKNDEQIIIETDGWAVIQTTDSLETITFLYVSYYENNELKPHRSSIISHCSYSITDREHFIFTTQNGSVYRCSKKSYLNFNNTTIQNRLSDFWKYLTETTLSCRIFEENTDWFKIKWYERHTEEPTFYEMVDSMYMLDQQINESLMTPIEKALLALADRIEEANGNPIAIAPQAATELRRQHSEIEQIKAERDALREEVQKWQQSFAGHLYVKTEDYAELVAKRDALTTALQDRLRELKAERDAAQENHLRVRDECFANMAAYRDMEAERDAAVKLAQDYAREAYEDVRDWSSYASEYFRRKWSLDDDLVKWLKRGAPNAPREVQQIDAARGEE